MNENIVLLLKRAEQDEALVEKFKGISSPDEAYALASSIQGGFTKEEFIAAMDEIRKDELSDTDLKSLAGGDADDVVGSIFSAITSASTISALAAV